VIHRQLSDLGWDVQVAPSLIPRKAGERLKTDHRDSLMLACLHRTGELVAQGLVKRTWDPNDRRTVFVSATPAGVKRADAVMRALAKDKFGLPVLGVEDIETLVAVTKKLPPW
jgi:hypothetical protein